MIKQFNVFLFLLVIQFCFFCQRAEAQLPTIHYLEDIAGNLTPDSLALPKWQSKFKASSTEVLSFGYNANYYWVLLNPKLEKDQTYILECNTAFVQYLDLYKYSLTDSIWQVNKGGYDIPWKDKQFKHRFPSFQIDGKDSHLLYLRIKNNGLSFPITISTTTQFEERYLSEHLFFGLLTGILFFVFFMNVNLATTMSSRVHYIYSILLFCYLIFSLAGDGYLFYLIKDFPLLSKKYNAFSNIIEALTYTAIALYGITFFKIHYKSLWFWAFICFVVFWSIHALNFNNALLSSILVEWGSTLVLIFAILLGVRGIIQKQTGALTYLLAYAVYLIFSLLQLAQYNGLVVNYFPLSYIVLGSQMEVLILGYGLTRVTAIERNFLKVEKEIAQKENIELIENQKIKLEHLVEEKTQELQATNEELVASNEELKSQHDEIIDQRIYVEELNNTISHHNQELEKEVIQRTEKLIEYNQQLEQFAFITAHNLRAPVARILGLGNVMELEKDESVKVLLGQKIIQSCKELDVVIHDINTILMIRNDHNPTFDSINLSDILSGCLVMLKPEIEKNKATINTEFIEKVVIGIIPYLQSILSNLIQNAIKYRHPHRDPIITISTKKINGFIEIELKDNGIGIDLEKHGDKVFGLYKRFHSHIDGRGIGLFLVKSQVEAMKGSISIQSTIQVGTTFTILLPIQ